MIMDLLESTGRMAGDRRAVQEDFYIIKARAITEFLLKHGPDLLCGMDVKTAFTYVFVNLVDRCVFTVKHQDKIVSILIARGISQAELVERFTAKEPLFKWERSHDHANAIYVAGFSGRRADLPALYGQVKARWPDWKQKRIIAMRGNNLVELSPELVERYFNG